MHFKAMAAQLAANPPVPPALLARFMGQPAAPAPGGPALPARPTQVQVTGAAGAQLPLNPQIDPKLLEEMQKKSDFFYEYRRGRGYAWDAEARRHIWSQLVIPVAKNYPTTPDLTAAFSYMTQVTAHKDQGAQNFFVNLGERRLKEKNKAVAVKPNVRKVINEHSGDLLAAGARFVRLLGAGGHGAACLYEITNQRTGTTKRIVVKISLRGDDMKSEKKVLGWLKHSRHITQLTSIAEVHEMLGHEVLGFPNQQPKLQGMPLDADTVMAVARVDAAQSLLIQIFSNRGALDRMVSILAYMRIPARDKFCWRLLECLVRGCIALWSPVRRQGLARGRPVPLSAGLLTEQLPPMDENMLLNLVHFDLDVYNIFLTDDDQHPVMPMAQIGDFGTTRNMHSDHYRMQDIYMWGLRHTGKRGFITPEQFAEEWDHFYRNPWTEAGRPSYKFKPIFGQVAGNYGMWTNIWSIGLTMWIIITQRAPLHPPVPREIPILPNMEADPNGVGRNTFWTYGYPLDQPGQSQIGDELRHLVLRMMAHDPYDRPSLKELLGAAEAGCALEDDDDPSREQTDLETDKNIANFFRHYFGQIDPPPSDPVIPDPAKPLASPPPVPAPVWHMPPPP
ncbi:hypothetical protein MAPG_07835 [Magnaporthiopsis poae ATCC 64411]|uniref:non-specific serine/threonine protein kinase n=1 Tax=Magnaporthiopsis poae (strain ATCC 64411 / 73-15) TaxID=644358 RepID=A0A0C4E5R1_MAGP6|nr:hypothetical protein MAPG_07835 [Magnaporthiopsis poae ATCC 64411]